MSSTPVLLAIDFGGTKIAIAMADPGGRRLASATVDSAGEIGAHLRAVGDVGLALDDRTPLEWMVSAKALAKRATGAVGSARELSAAEAFEASAGNQALDHVIDEFVAELAFHLVNLANCI